MKSVDFDDLARMPHLLRYEESFRKATGVSLKLVSPDRPKQRVYLGAFCALAGCTPAGCVACLNTQAHIGQYAAGKLAAQQVRCFAGLTEIAVPVMIDGRHVATLMSGQVFRRKPLGGDFERVLKKIGLGMSMGWEKKARKAYFETPVISAGKLEAVIELLTVFARHLSDDAGRYLIASSDGEPGAIGSAKTFVQSHFGESITLAQVAKHVRLSRFHFCKLFKKTTGMTLTEYVSRVRVEKAKALLLDPLLRISEVVFAAGFGSIPQFNSVFKRCIGMPPTAYRAMLCARSRAQVAAGKNQSRLAPLIPCAIGKQQMATGK